MKRRRLWLSAAGIASLGLLALWQIDWLWVSDLVLERWLPVAVISPQGLATSLRNEDVGQYIIFDVRSKPEFAVSHLPQAHHLDPQIAPAAFLQQFADSIQNRHVIFYCSAGFRSSAVLQRLQQVIAAAPVRSARHLRGGIFRWYRDDLPLADSTGVVRRVHPYSRFWGWLLLRDPDGVRRTP